MTDLRLHTEGSDDHLLMQDGHAVGGDTCCCCICDNCCPSMETWYSQLLYDFSSDCDDVTGGTAAFGGLTWITECTGANVTVCSFALECVGDVADGTASYRLIVHMESSGDCAYDAELEAVGTCFPPDVTFTFNSGASCCGNVTLRFYSPDCDLTTCNCRCDNHCLEDDMVLSATNHSGCAGVGSSEISVSCSTAGGCTWTGSGSFGGDCSTSYDYEIVGDDLHNCEGQYTLTIRSGAAVIWTGKDNCDESLCYPTALVWGPIELPCCGGGSIKIIMSIAP